MLTVKSINKRLPNGRLLLEDISFKAKQGDFVAIIGLSGVGKTVLLRCINALTRPDSGEVVLADGNGGLDKINSMKGKELRRIRRRIGVIFQSFDLVKRLSALDNVLMGKLGRINPLRSLLYGFTDEEVEKALNALEKVGLKDLALQRVETMSGGEMQRVALARVIIQEPTLLLADEPVANLDPKNAEVVLDCLKPLARDMAILGVFHQPELVVKYCTRVIGIKERRIVYDGSPHLSADDLERIYGNGLPQEGSAIGDAVGEELCSVV